MNNKKILNITLQQSAYDWSCETEDFLKKKGT